MIVTLDLDSLTDDEKRLIRQTMIERQCNTSAALHWILSESAKKLSCPSRTGKGEKNSKK